MQESLSKAGFSDLVELESQIKELKLIEEKSEKRIQFVRSDKEGLQDHVADEIRNEARQLGYELEAIETAIGEIIDSVSGDKRHLNEILALSTKVRRLQSARAVLNDVEFEKCPRCAQDLQQRDIGFCSVCGQDDAIDSDEELEEGESVKADIQQRVKELEEIIDNQSNQLVALNRRRTQIQNKKSEIDKSLILAMREYDSAYLAEALDAEKQRAAVQQEIAYLERLKLLPQRVEDLRHEAEEAKTQESTIKGKLRDAREKAEKDKTRLNRLSELFLDCLLRAKITGFAKDDIVKIEAPWFLPEVFGRKTGEMATTAFSTIGSGGKKNLFKCCFALAVHRLAAEFDTLLPTVLIIDSPMKNISERENRKQFEGFHELLYELADTELKGTQFILIDKEFCPPANEHAFDLTSRHMKVDDDDEGPLISYFRG